MTAVSFNASNNESALKLRPLSFGKSPFPLAVLITNSGIDTTFLNPMYIGHLSPCQVLSAEGGAAAVTKSAEGGAAANCRRSVHLHPLPIGRVKNYRENRILSTGQIVAGKFRPKKNVRGQGNKKLCKSFQFVGGGKIKL